MRTTARRLPTLFVALAVGVLALANCGTSSDPASSGELPKGFSALEKSTLRVGLSDIDPAIAYDVVAEAKGYYEKYGLKVQIRTFEGATKAIQALQAGQIDVANVSAGPVVASLATDRPLKMVAVMKSSVTNVFMAGKGIDEPEDLVGKQIAISGFGAISHAAALIALEQLGVKSEDVTFVQIGGASARIAAVAGGSAAAAAVPLGSVAPAEKAGLTVMRDLTKTTKPEDGIPSSGLVASSEFVEANPNTLLSLVAANLEGLAYVFGNEREAAEAYADFADVPVDEAFEQVKLQFSVWAPRDGRPQERMFENARESLLQIDPDLAKVDVTNAYSTQFVDKLEEIGFYERLKSGN